MRENGMPTKLLKLFLQKPKNSNVYKSLVGLNNKIL